MSSWCTVRSAEGGGQGVMWSGGISWEIRAADPHAFLNPSKSTTPTYYRPPHAGVDVEGMQLGIDDELVALLGAWSPCPVTYAGGARTLVGGWVGGRAGLTALRATCLPALYFDKGSILKSPLLTAVFPAC